MPEPIAKTSAASEVSQTGRLFVCSGHKSLPLRLAQPGTGDVQTQASELMKALGSVLEARSMTFEQVVKGTIYLVDLDDAARVETVFACFFDGMTVPATTVHQVDDLPDGARVDIELIALV